MAGLLELLFSPEGEMLAATARSPVLQCPHPRAHIAVLAQKLGRKVTMFFLTSVYLQPLLQCRCPPCTRPGRQVLQPCLKVYTNMLLTSPSPLPEH